MDTPNGLVVPVVKNVQSMSVFEVAAQMNRLMELGYDGKLQQSDLSGGTFTLSNIGTVCIHLNAIIKSLLIMCLMLCTILLRLPFLR